ncbi:MAG: tRNA (N6-isopentenyl adenosine(37)-C2)-methylthiotransferase MiaB [Flavobacteriales bacterium]
MRETREMVEGQKAHKKLFIESYGCQMNFSDSEVAAAILGENGYRTTSQSDQADLVLLNTCSIRERAEQTVRKRLEYYSAAKRKNPRMKVGVLGCMAARLKSEFLQEKMVDLVVGPDAYRDLPDLLEGVESGSRAVNVGHSKTETYAEVSPVRLGSNGVSAFVSITRGCDNMCTFCVVPFTRGRERSRDPQRIVAECKNLWQRGYREVTLLGQNVDSYLWYGGGPKKDFKYASEFAKATAMGFAQLLELVAQAVPAMRIRFSTSNPQDMTEDVLHVMAAHDNICKSIHLPVQSGSNRILKLMNRQYTHQSYRRLIDKIRDILPGCGISHDMIAGFCSETESDHRDTLRLMDYVKYHFGHMFAYSNRPGTAASKKLADDIPESIKKRRLRAIIARQQLHSSVRMKEQLGRVQAVLVEGTSKKSEGEWYGRNTQNAVVVFPKAGYKPGDLVGVEISDCTPATLIGSAVGLA